MEYVTPRGDMMGLTCPNCGVLTRQYHHSRTKFIQWSYGGKDNKPTKMCQCINCGRIWLR